MMDKLTAYLDEKPPEKEGHYLLFCRYGYWHYMENGIGYDDCFHLGGNNE